jgi:hypothetical protein
VCLAQVCRSAGYYEHALAVAQAANEPEWYLDILLEDCRQYDEALEYLRDLPRQQAAAALGRHGKVGAHAWVVMCISMHYMASSWPRQSAASCYAISQQEKVRISGHCNVYGMTWIQ